MIYTVTFNPALDYVMNLKQLQYKDINRTESEQLYYGGKGINVSVILSRLKVDNIALGFLAGFSGKKIEEMLNAENIKNDFVYLKKGYTRINVKIKADEDYDINAQGPDIELDELNTLFDKFEKLKSGDFLVLAGSIPNSLPDDIYEEILAKLQNKGINFAVDATGDLLLNVLKYKPFLIKPNHHELGEMFNVELKNKEEIIIYAKKLQEIGARNVIISMAGDGAILIEENGEITISDTPKGTLVNSVGAGDSMVGGFLAGIAEDKNIKEAFKMGVATGSASAFSEGLATKDKVEELLKQL